MRSSRRNSIGEVSLFSFQDIIMSTAGVMIMLMLLFSISLTKSSARQQQADSNDKQKDDEKVSSDLEQLQNELLDLRKQEEAAKVQLELELVQQAVKQKHVDLAPILAELDKLNNRLKEKVQIEQRKQQQLSEFHHLIQARDPLRNITLQTSDPAMRSAIIIECDSKQIRCGTLDSPRVFEFEASSQVDQFVKFILSNSSNASRPLVFLAKPSARNYAAAFADSFRDRGYTVGIDPLEENATVVLGGVQK